LNTYIKGRKKEKKNINPKLLNIRTVKLNNKLRERKNEENALPKSEN
jgi:hypothetical protein